MHWYRVINQVMLMPKFVDSLPRHTHPYAKSPKSDKLPLNEYVAIYGWPCQNVSSIHSTIQPDSKPLIYIYLNFQSINKPIEKCFEYTKGSEPRFKGEGHPGITHKRPYCYCMQCHLLGIRNSQCNAITKWDELINCIQHYISLHFVTTSLHQNW